MLEDGKTFFGGDVLTAIRNIPADLVDKLQVIDDYGDKARLTGVRSGNADKVLNIVLKAEKRNGEFGNADVGGGNQGKYTNHTFANLFRGDRQLSAQVGISNNSPAGSNHSQNGGFNYVDQWTLRWGGAISLSSSSQSPHSAGNTIHP